MRWAWRMFRREWRRQLLILVLLTLAVAATTVGLALISNVELGPDATFGTASAILTLPGSDQSLAADLAALQHGAGPTDVVYHQSVAIPGSVSTLDLRAENPAGLYVHVTVRLDAGRYPTRPGEVALTSDAAQTFGVQVGSVWPAARTSWRVVGVVENPLALLDHFALVAPGQISAPDSVAVFTHATTNRLQSLRLPSHQGLDIMDRGTSSKAAAEAIVLVLATIGMLFVGLLAVAGFAVVAQRRMRSLGMLSSLGATDRQVRLVMVANGAAVGATAAVGGGLVGLAIWVAFTPTMQSIVNHRIDRFKLPWWAIGAALVLAFVTAVVAAWWPARAVTRVPVMAALSGRPPRPQPARRFAAAGVVLLGAGLGLLLFAYEHKAPVIISGTIATVLGILFMAPLAIQALAKVAGRAPVSVRLALRDLARYQARSGAALGAATLAVAIAATIAISSAAAQGPAPQSNLPANQLILHIANSNGPGSPIPVLTTAQQEGAQTQVNQLAATLKAQSTVPLYEAYDPTAALQAVQPGQPLGQITASLVQVITSGRGVEIRAGTQLYVATTEVLSHYGITPDRVNPAADIISSRRDLGGLQIFLPIQQAGPKEPTPGPGPGPGDRFNEPAEATHPTIETVGGLPSNTSAPETLITERAMQALGLQPLASGWLLQTANPLTKEQIDIARKLAASAGMYVETKTPQASNAPLRNWSTAAGILVALGVLAATVGLIRSETAGDLRTLTATGASSTTRRAITAATAGALALLGAVVGTVGAYAALLAWYRNNLHPLTNIPITNLAVIVIGLPLLASAGGWLLAGQEPRSIGRQALE